MCTKTYRRLNVDFIAVFVSLHHQKAKNILNTSTKSGTQMKDENSQQLPYTCVEFQWESSEHSFEASEWWGEKQRDRAQGKRISTPLLYFSWKSCFFFSASWLARLPLALAGSFAPSLSVSWAETISWLPSGAGPVLRQAGKMKKWEKGKRRRRRRNPINFTFFFFSLFKPSGSFLLKLHNLMNTKYFSQNVALLLHIFVSFASFPFRVVFSAQKAAEIFIATATEQTFSHLFYDFFLSFVCKASFPLLDLLVPSRSYLRRITIVYHVLAHSQTQSSYQFLFS